MNVFVLFHIFSIDSPMEAPKQPNEVSIINAILQMKKLRHQKIK